MNSRTNITYDCGLYGGGLYNKYAGTVDVFSCTFADNDVTGSPHDISEDITGNDRKIGSDVDIGAYEYDPN